MIYTLSILALVGLAALGMPSSLLSLLPVIALRRNLCHFAQTGLTYYRHLILPYFPPRLLAVIQRSENHLRAYAPLSTFESQRDSGLSSVNFDLEGNIAGDSRVGLDERSSDEVRKIMRERGVT